jgi:DNA topoisomerase IB
VLACATRLLDLGFFRIGGEEYLADNATYGLTTMRRRHLRLERGVAVFAYRGKGSQRLVQEINDPIVMPTLKALKRSERGPQLLVYRAGRRWQPVRAGDVNEYISRNGEGEFTAKDFRTWNATVLAAVGLAIEAPRAATRTARARAVSRVVTNVAHYLGNTPAVSRSSYIDPRVIDRFLAGDPLGAVVDQLEASGGPETFPDREAIEAAVIRLLAR